jgi:hypothetical protein
MSDKVSHLLDRPENKLKRETIKVDGEEYEVRALSKAQMQDMYDEAEKAGDDVLTKARALMWCVYDPDESDRVFSAANIEALENLPAHDEPEWYSTLWGKVCDLNGFL